MKCDEKSSEGQKENITLTDDSQRRKNLDQKAVNK